MTKVTELETRTFFENVLEGYSSQQIKDDFDEVMAKIKRQPLPQDVPEWDMLPDDGEQP